MKPEMTLNEFIDTDLTLEDVRLVDEQPSRVKKVVTSDGRELLFEF